MVTICFVLVLPLCSKRYNKANNDFTSSTKGSLPVGSEVVVPAMGIKVDRIRLIIHDKIKVDE
jgi:hypothetical protein